MFLVHSRFTEPDLAADLVAEINSREAIAAAALQRDGVLVHLWRETGTRNAWGVWKADSEEEMMRMLNSLPWAGQMEFDVVRISIHPNSIIRERINTGKDDGE